MAGTTLTTAIRGRLSTFAADLVVIGWRAPCGGKPLVRLVTRRRV